MFAPHCDCEPVGVLIWCFLLINSVWFCSSTLICSSCSFIVTSRSWTVVSKFTILVFAAFNSRLRKLILAVSVDMVASKVFDFLLVEVPEALDVFPGTEKGGACTLSEVRIESEAVILCEGGRGASEKTVVRVEVEGGRDTVVRAEDSSDKDEGVALLGVLVLVLLRFAGLFGVG